METAQIDDAVTGWRLAEDIDEFVVPAEIIRTVGMARIDDIRHRFVPAGQQDQILHLTLAHLIVR